MIRSSHDDEECRAAATSHARFLNKNHQRSGLQGPQGFSIRAFTLPFRPFVGFIDHDHEPSQNMEHDHMSKLMVRGGKEQRQCSHLIVLRYDDDNHPALSPRSMTRKEKS